LNPSQEKSPDYQGYIVRMNDGRIYRGTQFHFRGESAELLLESGELVRFALRDTEEYRALDESLMPERLEETMSVSELRDLIEYLATLRPSAGT
jgi:putative heme-binding domain-containing protein